MLLPVTLFTPNPYYDLHMFKPSNYLYNHRSLGRRVEMKVPFVFKPTLLAEYLPYWSQYLRFSSLQICLGKVVYLGSRPLNVKIDPQQQMCKKINLCYC